MNIVNLDREWTFRRCFLDTIGMLDIPGKTVNLPHDAMIETDVSKDAPAGLDSGFFKGDVCSYTKYVNIPEEWADECIGLYFDGAMMHMSVDVNGCKTGEHHYGYTPFYIDITGLVSFGEENRITINCNTGIQPSSRWYTGSGLFRGVSLCHSPKVHIKQDGIFVYTKEIDETTAFLEAQVEVCNETSDNRIAEVCVEICADGSNDIKASAVRKIQINPASEETARISVILREPLVWDIDCPNLYTVKAYVKDKGIWRTHFVKNAIETTDSAEVLFGIRTITADAIRGLRINGKTVKLKGGCLHHDNGLLGAVSLYESEARKVRKLKEIGFNAIRTAHNPPSSALVEACDREGMYIFDEAFDAWGMAKRPGDFSNYFEYLWEQEITSFVKRDRTHPSVIMWSTGNEIPERGGLNNGYTWATRLAEKVKSLDGTRPVSNGICSFWCGLDDFLAKSQSQTQNAKNSEEISWETLTEPFTNGLDVVGYNYMEEQYEKDHEMFPDRVILGSENFPREIGFRWPKVEALPYVIGDFTWTAWDYIGEAGIGKSLFVEPDDPLVEKGPWAVMPQGTSYYPWRLANDADYDITGKKLAQGAYRSVVWGSNDTYLYVQHPSHFGKTEVIGMWGFTDVTANWNYEGFENKPVEVIAFSNADEVELIVNGKTVGRKPVCNERPLPNSVKFETVFEPGVIEAVSYRRGAIVSRDKIVTAGSPSKLLVTPEKTKMKADGHDAVYAEITLVDANGIVVPSTGIKLNASVSGPAYLAGFGTGNPITEENYTDNETVTFRGSAMAVIRSGYESGTVKVIINAPDISLETILEIELSQ